MGTIENTDTPTFDKIRKVLNIEDVFDIQELIKSGKLIDKNGFIYINKDYIYLSNEILINFV